MSDELQFVAEPLMHRSRTARQTELCWTFGKEKRMKRASLAVLLILVVSSIVATQTKRNPTSKSRLTASTPANAEQSLKVAEHQWIEAFKNRDKEALNRILDDRFVFTDDKGQVR